MCAICVCSSVPTAAQPPRVPARGTLGGWAADGLFRVPDIFPRHFIVAGKAGGRHDLQGLGFGIDDEVVNDGTYAGEVPCNLFRRGLLLTRVYGATQAYLAQARIDADRQV